jgi:hypothetical protein
MFEVLSEGDNFFFILLKFMFIIFTYLIHLKISLEFMFALNFDTIYLFKFLV